MQKIKAKFDGKCDECGETIEAGELCLYDFAEKFIIHETCEADRKANAVSPIKPAQAGVVARFKQPVKSNG